MNILPKFDKTYKRLVWNLSSLYSKQTFNLVRQRVVIKP